MKIVLFILLIPIICFSQSGQICGNVSVKQSKEKVFGASIQLLHTQNGSATDTSGNYRIKNVPQGKYMIRCQFAGLKPQVDTIEVKGNDSVVIKNFYMEPEPGKKINITKQKNMFSPLKKE